MDWGDGSTPVVATITTVSAGNYDITTGGHNYAQTGSHTLSVTITDAQGFVVGTASPTLTVNAISLVALPAIRANAGIPTGELFVASISGTPTPDFTGYTAMIDWGDGTPPSAGFVNPAITVGDNITSSGHTYAQGGIYNLLVTVRDSQGFLVGSTPTLVVVSVPLSGRLSPQSDSGISNSDGITNIATPTFVGNTAPGAIVEIFAAPAGSTAVPGSLIATGSAQTSGYWSATVVNAPLANGYYSIIAEAINTFGNVLAAAPLGTLVIDTIAPVVTGLTFDRFDDTVTVTYQDNLSGLSYNSIASSSNYQLSAKPLARNVPVPKMLLPTSILITPGTSATSPEVVSVVFNHGKTVRGGRYLVVIDSGSGDLGVQDVAGNALDGNFYGTFPSGDGLPGGNFVASIDTFHNHVVLAPVPAKDGYVPPSAAVDPPAGSKPIKKTVKVVHSAQKAVSQPVRQAHRVHDLAIESLFVPKKVKHHLV